MVKLLVCLLSALGLAVLVLQLRQQRLELNHQANELHNRIEEQQARLWNQQLQIAVYTAPNAIRQTVHRHDLKLVSNGQAPLPAGRSSWLDTARKE